MKYIDAEKLRSVLQNTINSMKEKDVKGERYDAFLNGKLSICEELLGCIDSFQQEPRFPQYDNIVEKVFGAGNLDGWERDEAEILVALAKEELLKSLQQEQPNKYETALEKARKWMPNVNQGGHAILIDIFPELGEGLDPRYGGRKQEQTEVDLEKEIDRFWDSCIKHKNERGGNVIWSNKIEIEVLARHFAEWGAIHLNARKNE